MATAYLTIRLRRSLSGESCKDVTDWGEDIVHIVEQ